MWFCTNYTNSQVYPSHSFFFLIPRIFILRSNIESVICHYLENESSHYLHSSLQPQSYTLFSYKIRVGRGLRRYTEDKSKREQTLLQAYRPSHREGLRFRLIYKSSDRTMISVKINTLCLLKNQKHYVRQACEIQSIKKQGLAAQTGISLRKRDLKMLHRTTGIRS